MAASPSQEAVFTEVKDGKGNISVQAAPGAGKTYTSLEALKLVPRFKKTVFLSFSNAIVNELKSRVPSYVKASTLHSLGCGMIMARYKHLTFADMDENKYFKLALQMYEKKDKKVYKSCYEIQDICNMARLTLNPFDADSLRDLCDKYVINYDEEMLLIAEILLFEHTQDKYLSKIDFTDMLYYPAVYPHSFVNVQFDYVFLDEAQDNNNCQTELIAAILKPNTGRFIMVGDKNQSIFGFMGSDINSFEKLVGRFQTKELKLTHTYRCSKAIVKLAQEVYPDDIEALPDAPEGIVRRGDLKEAQEGDMVICRNTRPLIEAFFDFIMKNKKSYIVGKDLEKGLVALAESVMDYSTVAISQNLEIKLQELEEELKADGVSKPTQHDKYIALLEKCDIVGLILSKVDRPADLVPKIHEIFHPDKKAIRLLTAHRSKGLECERVFFIETFNREKLLPSKYAILDWQKIQEKNLLFVTYTRAKTEFVFVDYVKVN